MRPVFAPAIRRQAKQIRHCRISLYENSRWAKLVAISSGSGKPSPIGNILDENRKRRPRQSACCLKPDPSSNDVKTRKFVTKVKFSSRGLGGSSVGRYLIALRRYILFTKIAPVFARAARGASVRNRRVGLVLLSARLWFFALCLLVALTNYHIFGTNDCSVRWGYRFRFCGNMCAVISV